MHHHQRKIRRLTATIFMVALMAPSFVPFAEAATFNPDFIISDAEIRDVSSMSFLDIYRFLDEMGQLNTIFMESPDLCTNGKPEGYEPYRDSVAMVKGPAQLIYDAANCYGINPKYILTVLQKESSIITRGSLPQDALDWAAGYALCDGCYKTSELAQKYKGLDRQIDVTAGWMDWFWNNYQKYPTFKHPNPETPYIISGVAVTPLNISTAALYTYTPHVGNDRIGGNKLFWDIWQRWWGEGEAGIEFPEGTLLRNLASGAVALIQGGKFRPVTNASVLETRFAGVVPIDLGPYEFKLVEDAHPGVPLKFADYSLVRTEDGTIYLLDGPFRRQIASMEVFSTIGFNPEEVEDVTGSDIADYTLGSPITLGSAYPLGQLVQDLSTGGVYFVRDGEKHPIWDRSILATNFTDRTILQVHPDVLAAYPTADPVGFRDGTLVKAPNDPAVYVIAGGLKRRIPSEEVFLGYGYKWSSIVTTSDKALTLHLDGDTLLLVDTAQVETALAE